MGEFDKKFDSWSKFAKLRMRALSTDNDGNWQMQAQLNYPDLHTVQFFIEPIQVTGLPIRSMAEALVTWSVGGNRLFRRCTLGNGLSLSGTGQQVDVVVKDITRQDGGAFPAGFDPLYKVGVQVARGTRPSQNQVPTLLPEDENGWVQGQIGIVAGATSLALTIPRNAGVISAAVFVAAGAAIPPGLVLVLQQSAAQTLRVYDPRDYGEFVAIAPNVNEIAVFNNSAVAITASVLYGIDG